MQPYPFVLLVALMQCFGTSAFAQSSKTILDQPLDQQTSVAKIIALGGDWEAPSKTVLIGLVGEKFTNETFELLKPLKEMRILYLSEIPADDNAFEHCKDLHAIEEIQIRNCKLTGTGLKHLAKCKRLQRVIISETPISDECLEIISHFESVETLSIENFDTASKITEAGIRRLSTLKKAKQIDIDITQPSSELEAELRRLLPKCKVHIATHIPEPKK
jgi:hypothetical protein